MISVNKKQMKLKEVWKKDFIDFMLIKSNKIFNWKNLPDTIPDYILERMLQEYGKVIFYKYNNDFYVFDFSYSQYPNVYNEPSGILFTNVYLKLTVNETRQLDNTTKNGVIILSDTKQKGLLPIYSKYGDLLSEGEISLKTLATLDRMKVFLTASDARSKIECENFLTKIENGELSVIGDNAIFDSVKTYTQNVSNTNMQQYIELIQYLKASCFNEIGINANYNLKRERLTSDEIQLNDFGLLPLVENMLYERQKAVEKINEKFGLNIEVELNDVWKAQESIIDNLKDDDDNQQDADNKGQDADDNQQDAVDDNQQDAVDDNQQDADDNQQDAVDDNQQDADNKVQDAVDDKVQDADDNQQDADDKKKREE